MKNNFLKNILFIMMLLVISLSSFSNAAISQTNFSTSNIGSQPESPSFTLNLLKYDPFPVNPGESFDLWVQVQNIGQKDAENVTFEILNEFPFSSEKPIITYEFVSGTINAYKNMKAGEQIPQENKLVLKYRVKVAENAKDGENNLKLKITTKETTHSYDLPISIDKTKTSFEINMRDSNNRRTTFSLANIGEKTASSVVINLKETEQLLQKEKSQIIIGNLNAGDFTTVSFPIIYTKDTKEVTFEIAYTDISGARVTTEKTVPISILNEEKTIELKKSFLEQYSNWIYATSGILIGLLIGMFFFKGKKSE